MIREALSQLAGAARRMRTGSMSGKSGYVFAGAAARILFSRRSGKDFAVRRLPFPGVGAVGRLHRIKDAGAGRFRSLFSDFSMEGNTFPEIYDIL